MEKRRCENTRECAVRSRTIYFAPEWIEPPVLSRIGSNTDKVFRALRTAGEEGITIRRMAAEADLSKGQVKHALAGLQSGTRACVLAQHRSVAQNIEFVANRILLHLRWDDPERARLTLDWFLSRHHTHPEILGTVAEKVLAKIEKDSFSVIGVSFTPEEAERIARQGSEWVVDLAREAGLTASSWHEGIQVFASNGAKVIDFGRFRQRRARQMLEGDYHERMEGMLLLLSAGLRRI